MSRVTRSDNSPVLYWIAAALILILVGLIALCAEMSRAQAWLAQFHPSLSPPARSLAPRAK